MTIEVGVLCQDGVVLGADSVATFSDGVGQTIEQKTKKIEIIENSIIVAGTGQVGLGQRFVDIVRTEYSKKLFAQKSNIDVGRTLASAAIKDFISTNVKPGAYGALLAYASGGNFHLCEFAVADFQPEWKTPSLWYVSVGCGQRIADPFLGFIRRVFWQDTPPKVADATWAVAWTLSQAFELNTGGINGPPQMAVLKKGSDGKFSASLLGDAELQEHMNVVEDAEKHLRNYKDILVGKAAGCAAPPEMGTAPK